MTAWAAGLLLAALPGGAAPPDSDDEALVKRAQRGERAAFEALYRRHAGQVFARLSRLVGPVPERDDLLQEVFLGLHRALPRFRGDAALATLLHRITANVAYDHLRRRRRRRGEQLGPEALAELVSDEPDPEARARRAQALARVFVALDRIRPKKRVALLLRVVEGLSFDEIGAIVGASADTAKKRAQHGMRELEAMFADRPGEEP